MTEAPDPEAAQAAIEYCYAQGWSDGLPLVPASQPLVDAFLATTTRAPDEVIGELEQVGRNCTVYLAAVNAAMAGCLPEYFPVVLAAFDALMRERAARGGGWQSTSGPAPMIVVNGPVRHELGFNTVGGAFGPGFRPNATVARAIGLIVRNAFGIRPHVLEQATQGLPGRWSICLAENEEESPWPPFAADGGQPDGVSAVSATLLRTCEFVDNRHTQDPEQVLWDVADTISRTGSLIFRDTSAGVVFCPEHAQMLAGRRLRQAGRPGLAHGALRAHRRRPAPRREERPARPGPLRRPRRERRRHVHPHPALAHARPPRRRGRAQRGDLHGGPDLRRMVRHGDPGRCYPMIDAERAVVLRSTLAADGYELDVAEEGDRVRVTIIATDQACADCLVPKDLMRAILAQTLGVPADAIDLTYPRDL